MPLKKYFSLYLLSIIGGIILGLPWVNPKFAPFIFCAWIIPLLIAENTLARFWIYTGCLYLLLVTWNGVAAWWLWNATGIGSILTFLANSLLMIIPFIAYRKIRMYFGFTKSYVAFALLFLCFEYMHFNWEIAYPWLTLGNVFATHSTWIQWYEFTGVAGGSFWVLITNYLFIYWIRKVYQENPFLEIRILERILFLLGFIYILSLFKISGGKEFLLLKSMRSLLGIATLALFFSIGIVTKYLEKEKLKTKKVARYFFLAWAMILIFPMAVLSPITALCYKNNQSKYQQIDSLLSIHIIQPNIDPYIEKYNSDWRGQVNLAFELIDSLHIDNSTQKFNLFILPETFLPESIDKKNIHQNPQIIPFINYCKEHPNSQFITGAFIYEFRSNKSKTARKAANGTYYEMMNVALQITKNGVENIYIKSKLVPGVECIPYSNWLGCLESLSLDLGGVSGTLATQNERDIFLIKDTLLPIIPKIAPIICYESVFSDHCTEYIKKGANLLAIITNDAWWGNTPGYKYLNAYAGLRAIETRRYILRSANSGISCIYNDMGNLIQTSSTDILPWNTKGIISSHQIKLCNKKTFYATYGDYIYKIALWVTILWLLYLLITKIRRHN
ncbi:MAG: apolipoprotein N-acyltransferase [Chitinophagaceae bacterium]